MKKGLTCELQSTAKAFRIPDSLPQRSNDWNRKKTEEMMTVNVQLIARHFWICSTDFYISLISLKSLKSLSLDKPIQCITEVSFSG